MTEGFSSLIIDDADGRSICNVRKRADEPTIEDKDEPLTISIGLTKFKKKNKLIFIEIQNKSPCIELLFARRVVGEFVEWNVKLGGNDNCFVNGKYRVVSSLIN